MEVLSSNLIMLLFKGYFIKFSRNLELSEKHKLAVLWKKRHHEMQIHNFFATVSIGTRCEACVAHGSCLVSPVLPPCIQDAN